jgi:hypothetical protein
MPRTVTALFEDEASAERGRDALEALGVPRARIGLHRADAPVRPASPEAPSAEPWLPRLLDALFLPEEEVARHREAVRRGLVVVSATVSDRLGDAAARALDGAGALDPEPHEAAWREGGWSPAAASGLAGGGGAPAMMPGTGGLDAEAARALGTTVGDAAGATDPRGAAQQEPRLGRSRSYVIEAPLAEEADPDRAADDPRG